MLVPLCKLLLSNAYANDAAEMVVYMSNQEKTHLKQNAEPQRSA